jgi:hypothetical protein
MSRPRLTHPCPLFPPSPPARSSTEMLSCENKFFCDACGCLQEAQKRMKIKTLPPCLIFHLKRFKYLKHLNRCEVEGRGRQRRARVREAAPGCPPAVPPPFPTPLSLLSSLPLLLSPLPPPSPNRERKLPYRVVFPFELKLSNTMAGAEGADAAYSLFAVVVHVGSNMHHGARGEGRGGGWGGGGVTVGAQGGRLGEGRQRARAAARPDALESADCRRGTTSEHLSEAPPPPAPPGHYVSLIKSKNQWLFFDDDSVELIREDQVAATFGSTQVRRGGGGGAERGNEPAGEALEPQPRACQRLHTPPNAPPPPSAPSAPYPQEYSTHMDHGYILFYERQGSGGGGGGGGGPGSGGAGSPGAAATLGSSGSGGGGGTGGSSSTDSGGRPPGAP